MPVAPEKCLLDKAVEVLCLSLSLPLSLFFFRARARARSLSLSARSMQVGANVFLAVAELLFLDVGALPLV